MTPVQATRKPTKRQTAARPRARGFRAPVPVQDYIAELDQQRVVPKQIRADVNAKFPDDPVTARTLSRILTWQRAQRRDGEVWSPRAGIVEGVDVALALPAVAELLIWTDGRRRQLTVGEAQRVTFVRRAAPDIPIRVALRVALMYGRTTPENVLDAYLAFAPWRGPRELRKYLKAISDGLLPSWSPPTLAGLIETEEEIQKDDA